MNKIIAAALISAVALETSARAQTLDTVLGGVDFSIRGFATAGGLITNSYGAQFVRGAESSGGDKTAAENVDSNLGVQATARLNSWISATIQVLDDASIQTDPITWAYVAIDPTKSLSVKLGKMEMPVFMISDSRDIGYANPWVRPPNEVYALSLDEELRGGEATYTIPMGTTHLLITAYAGDSVAKTTGQSLNSWDVHGGELRWESDWVALRAGMMTEENELPARFTSPASHDKYTFEGFGAQTDHNNIVVQAEWVKRKSAGFGTIVNATGWYILGGYRVGTVLPYLSYATTQHSDQPSPAYVSGNQNTKAIGVRWDFLRSADLKLQFERVDPKGTNGVSFVNETQSFGNGTVSVTTLLVDFVF